MKYTFQKSRRAKSKDDFETWVESGISNTLNTFEGGDTRATTIIVFQQNQREELRIMTKPGAITSESGMHNQNFVVIKR